MKIHYKVVEHDGGWAYKLGDVFSEASPDRATALAAAKRVAAEQHVPGSAAYIKYQDEADRWHTEFSACDDRQDADMRQRVDNGRQEPMSVITDRLAQACRLRPGGQENERGKTMDELRDMDPAETPSRMPRLLSASPSTRTG